MSARMWRIGASVATLGVMAWAAWAQAPRAAGPASAPAIATVGSRRIPRDEFEARAAQAIGEYRRSVGDQQIPDELMPIVRRQILEGLIRVELLRLEAQRRGVVASQADAEAQLRQDPFFNPGGRFDATKFNAFKTGSPTVYANALKEAQERLGARALSERIERERTPDRATLETRLRRELSQVDADVLALRLNDFTGLQREPRESEVLDYYREHARDYQRPDRAVLTMVVVDRPALPESLASDDAARRAWDARMRQRADSLLAAGKAGAPATQLGEAAGGLRTAVTVLRDNFPRYWRGTARHADAVFAARAGSYLDEPIPGESGYLVVRVDTVRPTAIAPLREVAKEIRTRLRVAARQSGDDGALRALYQRLGDSLRTSGVRVRYAAFDEAAIEPGSPRPQDLDLYYRSHLADYSSFDSKRGGVIAKPFAEVADDVRARWATDRRRELARQSAAALAQAWARQRRDRRIERLATRFTEDAIVPLGAAPDTSASGRLVGDSLAARAGALGTGVARGGGRVIAFHVIERVPSMMPTFEQARTSLAQRLTRERDDENLRGARALFDAHPLRFATGRTLHYSRFVVSPPSILTVPLTRAEVEAYHRKHLEDYSAPQMVRVSHILIEPKATTEEADAAARLEATRLRDQVRAGADFGTLAREHTDDVATRPHGGDLGAFARGTMLPEFEDAAFSLQPGDLSEPVRTSLGYHVIKCQEILPAVVQPLVLVYSNVSADAARVKGDSLARARADSVRRSVRTTAAARAAGARLGFQVHDYESAIGTVPSAVDARAYFARIESLKPGAIDSEIEPIKGQGYAVTWIDSITPPQAPEWDTARPRAIEEYRRGAGRRALDAKLAELDSLSERGWSLDSVAVLWGGTDTLRNARPGTTIPGLGGRETLDSLLFGRAPDPGVEPGRTTAWVAFPSGAARVHVRDRREPMAAEISARLQQVARSEGEHALVSYFDELKKRYPVRILDPKLRDVELPTPPTTASR